MEEFLQNADYINMKSKLNQKKKAQLKIQVRKNQRFLVLEFLNKKSQLKIQEMSFMIVAVLLFFIFAGLFALSIFYTNLSKSATESAEARTLSAISNLAASPEFSCVDSKPNCVDGDKLMSLVGRRNYAEFWPFSSLKVIKISALNKTESERVECTISNYPECEVFIVYDDKVEEDITSSFVALCIVQKEDNIAYKKCELALLAAGTRIRIPE